MNKLKRKNHYPSSSYHTPFWGLQDEVNTLFESFFENSSSRPVVTEKGWAPTIEVKELENEYVVKAEMPGLSEDDVNVTVTENSLVLSGERNEERKEKKEDRHYSELSYGRFYRSILFDTEVDTEKVKATMKKGLLEISVAKKEESRSTSRKVQISS